MTAMSDHLPPVNPPKLPAAPCWNWRIMFCRPPTPPVNKFKKETHVIGRQVLNIFHILKLGALTPSKRKKILVKFKFGEGISQCISLLQACVYVSGSVACRPWSHLKDLNKAVSLQIYKKCNWQCACTELAICTACVEEHWARPRVQLQTLRHLAKIILADFNLPVSILTAKLPNLIPRQIFRLYSMSCLHAQCVYNSSHVYIVKCTVIQARAPLASFPCTNSVYQATPQGGGAWGRG